MTGKELANARMETGLSQEEFAKIIDISRTYLAKNEADRDKDIPDQLEFKVKKALERLNINIPSLNALATLRNSEAAEPSSTYRKGQAGRSSASNFRVHVRGLLASIVDDLPEAVYEVFEVEGASMETTISQGDRLLCRLDSVENMQDNRVYVLVTDDPTIKEFRQSGVWIKRCSHRKANNYISCRSDNKDSTEPYNTFRLRCDNIKEVWYPVLKITGHLADPNRDIYDRLDELESRIEMLEEDNG